MNYLSVFGEYLIFSLKFFINIPKIFKRRNEIVIELYKIGVSSIPLIMITSAFTGLVSSLQALYQTRGYIPKDFIGVMIAKATMIELAPVLSGLVISGKAGASIAAEIGGMKITEQIEALESMQISSYNFVFFPKIFAVIIMMPVFTFLANFIAVISAYVFSVYKYSITFHTFFSNMKNFFLPMDFWSGIIKSVFFGFFIGTISAFSGYKTQNSTEGVGKATTNAVVYSSISVLIMDFIVAGFIFGK